MNWHEFDLRWAGRDVELAQRWLENFFEKPHDGTPQDEYEWHWRAARWHHFCAMVKGETGPAEVELQRCVEFAKQAQALDGQRVEGHFWHGIALLEIAQPQGKIAVAKVLTPAARHLERAMQIDETYQCGAPVRGFGLVHQMRPFLLGGSLDRANDCFRRALQIAPHHSTNLLCYARCLWADRQPGKAREVCEKLLAAPDDALFLCEQRQDRRLATQLLAEINRSRDS